MLQQQQAPLTEQLRQISSQRDAATGELAALRLENQRLAGNVADLPRLRGEVTGKSKELAQLKTASKESNEVPIKNLLAFSADQNKRQATNSAFARVEELKAKLHLTPDQEKRIRDILFSNIEPESDLDTAEITGTLSADERKNSWATLRAATEAGVAALLTPEQQGLYAKLKTDEKKKSSSSFAKNETSAMKRELHLSPEQVKATTRILSGLPPGRGGPGNAADTNAKEQLELRLQALKPVLTPAQLQTYRQNKLQDLEQAEMAFKLFRSVTP
ncbi:MAG: hypothetical protein JWM68_5119 [Verrucomicrobiales bacterium]|nr:hypothetical protein [Verrucomicrobiales bacterium]